MPLKVQIKRYAVRQGFDDCRFTGAFLKGKMRAYKNWLARHGHAGMDYLARHLTFKENPRLLLKDVRCAIVVIKNYKNTRAPRLANRFKVARYAAGKDYHAVMEEKLRALENFIKKQDPAVQCLIGVDSRPIAERSLALEAGIGFLGKNSMVIKPGLGSYFFIGVILTTAEFEPDAPLKKDCGKCRLCIDACPTRAITEHSTLRAKRCISYQTIERKSPLTTDEAQKTKGWLFGCDICQEVCPYNSQRVPLTDWPQFLPNAGAGFDFFDTIGPNAPSRPIPADSPLKRAKNRLWINWETACRINKIDYSDSRLNATSQITESQAL